jgi:hypothetical protein
LPIVQNGKGTIISYIHGTVDRILSEHRLALLPLHGILTRVLYKP